MRATFLGLWIGLGLFLPACGGDDGGGGGGGGGEGLLCSPSDPCPDGQFCFNGICAVGCNSNADCADDQYCDTEFDRLCHNNAVATCPETPCADTQECVNGFCSTTSSETTCTPRPDGEDGCDEYSICIEDGDGNAACQTFPPCPADGDCPTGTVGAVCNDGYIPGKAHICLSSLCDVVADCPSQWGCVRGSDSDVLGMCSNGATGMPCASTDDCQDGLVCMGAQPGFVGFCFPGF